MSYTSVFFSSRFSTSLSFAGSAVGSSGGRTRSPPNAARHSSLTICAARASPRGINSFETSDDAFYMRRCVELAKTAIGHTSPNPMVGCVIVRNGDVVGEGFHPKPGQPHAEILALRDARSLAENAVAYVSLEPCNHFGRTPPCTEALIRARVKRVVIGMVDPNPLVSNKGIERLRESRIDVIIGVEEALCWELNEAYIHRMLTGKPLLTLRYSISVDGSIVDQIGKGAEEIGGYYSKLLQEYDGVIISSNLLAKLSNLPTSKEAKAKQPTFFVIAKGLSSLILSNINISASKIVVLSDTMVKIEPELEGIEVVILDQMNFNSILDVCAQKDLCSILLETRGDDGSLSELLEKEFDNEVIQKIVMEICPTWSRKDKPSFISFGRETFTLKNLKSRISNESIVIEGSIK